MGFLWKNDSHVGGSLSHKRPVGKELKAHNAARGSTGISKRDCWLACGTGLSFDMNRCRSARGLAAEE